MSVPPELRREQPNTYFVQDRSEGVELQRLQLQDQMLTTAMGGGMPEQSTSTRFARILDVGCGTGGWLLSVASTYPTARSLVGIDISPEMIVYAREQAAVSPQASRIQFRQMDALGKLDFPDHSFDMVNHRFGASFLRNFEWPKLLLEYQRVCQPGGMIRITEFDVGETKHSPALETLSDLFVQALFQAGRFFTKDKRGLTSQLVPLLQGAGLKSVQSRAWTLLYQAGTSQGQLFIEDISTLYRMVRPFLRKWTRVPGNYEEIYQQALVEMQHPAFVATMSLLTAWGETPARQPKKKPVAPP